MTIYNDATRLDYHTRDGNRSGRPAPVSGWVGLPLRSGREEHSAVWTELQHLISAVDSHTGDESSSEPAHKKRRVYEFSDSEDDNTSEQQSQASLAVFHYQSESEIDEQACPPKWWKSHSGAYPTTVALARKYLTRSATTVTGNIISKKRASLSPGNINKQVCLNNWLRD